MAGPPLLDTDKDSWCRERLEFVCAVVNGVDRESLKAQLEQCETDDEAEGLLQSLLWLQERNSAGQGEQEAANAARPTVAEGPGRRDDLGREPQPVTVVWDDPRPIQRGGPDPDFFLPVGHVAIQPGPYPEIRLPVGQIGLCQAGHAPDPQIFVPVRQFAFRQIDHQGPRPEIFPPVGHEVPDPRIVPPVGQLGLCQDHHHHVPDLHILPSSGEQTDLHQDQHAPDPHIFPSGEQTDPHQDQHAPDPHIFPSGEQTDPHQDQHAPDPHIFPSGAQTDLHQDQHAPDPYIFPSVAQNDHNRDHPGPDPQIIPPENQNDPPQNQEAPEDFEILPGVWDEQEQEVPQLQPEGVDDSEEEPHGFELLSLEQNDPVQQDFSLLDGGAVAEAQSLGEPDDTEHSADDQSRPTTTRDDPSGREESEDDESELEIFEDAPESPPPTTIPPSKPAAAAEEVPRRPDDFATDWVTGEANARLPPELEGAVGGVLANDEALERRLERGRPPWEEVKEDRMSGDERLARQLAQELETRIEDTSGDEELARRLAEESDGSEDADEQEDVDRLALELPQRESPRCVRNEEEEQEDIVACQVAFMMNMFPDAEPDYLHQRCVGTNGQQPAFEQLVEELLQKKTSEPRMSGFLKKQKQALLAKGGVTRGAGAEENATEYFLDPEQDVTANALHECFICYEEEVLEKNMATCNALYNYHKFCIDCIRKHVAALIGQGLSRFKCMNGFCEAEFSWRTLKRVMEPVVFQKIQERKQRDEIQAAGIENLESCPFCNFMIIMPDKENRVLECLNPECLQESCRLCKEQSHIPFRCEEIERVGQKDARTNIENQMAEAMIRECPRCQKRFIIEAGCNRMTCPCGAVMCYLCKTIITDDYHHFERSQVASNKCPLWSNAAELHSSEVRAAAARAKEELDPSISLLHDPTTGIL